MGTCVVRVRLPRLGEETPRKQVTMRRCATRCGIGRRWAQQDSNTPPEVEHVTSCGAKRLGESQASGTMLSGAASGAVYLRSDASGRDFTAFVAGLTPEQRAQLAALLADQGDTR